jgi:hypothetical protein
MNDIVETQRNRCKVSCMHDKINKDYSLRQFSELLQLGAGAQV